VAYSGGLENRCPHGLVGSNPTPSAINMKIFVKVNPSARQEEVVKTRNNNYLVFVKSPARANRANREALTLLADYFKTPVDKIKIIGGHKSSRKTIIVSEK
jgi:uncharacterized protein YggU (UPF0235/DUF167 family)